MTYEELLNVLKPTGIPWAYHHWEHPPDGPYGVYLEEESDPFYADGITYFETQSFLLAVYSPVRDKMLDKRVSDALTAASIPYTRDYAVLNAASVPHNLDNAINESECVYMTIFEIEV